MEVKFTNKKTLVDFDHTGEEIKLTGSVRIDNETETVEDITGSIFKVQSSEMSEERIGTFNLMSLNIYSMENIKYRTTASTMLDEVMVAAQTEVQVNNATA